MTPLRSEINCSHLTWILFSSLALQNRVVCQKPSKNGLGLTKLFYEREKGWAVKSQEEYEYLLQNKHSRLRKNWFFWGCLFHNLKTWQVKTKDSTVSRFLFCLRILEEIVGFYVWKKAFITRQKKLSRKNAVNKSCEGFSQINIYNSNRTYCFSEICSQLS